MAAPSLSAIPQRIEIVLKRAAKATGADFDYLLKTARRESAFKPGAKAKTSTAAGLFQFIEQTWLSTLKDAGPRHGLGKVADAIIRLPSGKYAVPDSAARSAILALRFDPGLSALMAGEFTRKNARILTANIGRKPSDGELYIGHFLGAANASKLINLARQDPNGPAAPHFSRAARANRAIFYTASGQPRSNSQVYKNLTRHYDSQLKSLNKGKAQPPASVKAREQDSHSAGEPARIRPLTQALFTIWQTPLDKLGEGHGSPRSAFHNLFSPGKTNFSTDSAHIYREAKAHYLPTQAQLLAAFGATDVTGAPPASRALQPKNHPAETANPPATNPRISELFGRKGRAGGGGILRTRNPGGI